MKITPRQAEVLAFIEAHITTHGAAPRYSEIGDHFNFSKRRAWMVVNQLIYAKKLVREIRPGHRSIIRLPITIKDLPNAEKK